SDDAEGIVLLEKSKAMESSTDMTTRQLMFSLIEVWKSSGKTQKEFCQEKDLAHHKFYYWLRKYNDHHRQSADESPFLSVSTQSAISSNLEIIWYLAGFFEQVKSRDFLTLTIQNSHEEDQIHRSPDHWDLERTGIRPESV